MAEDRYWWLLGAKHYLYANQNLFIAYGGAAQYIAYGLLALLVAWVMVHFHLSQRK